MQLQIKLIRTGSSDPDFLKLNKLLDAELAIRDGSEHTFYAKYNKPDGLDHIVLVYHGEMAVGCGALKRYDFERMEVKRMYVIEEYRKKGIARLIIKSLENWSDELGYKKCILETGLKQHEAISLYLKCGYKRIPNYGQYTGVENSICFEKEVNSTKRNFRE